MEKINLALALLSDRQKALNETIEPVFYRPAIESDKQRLLHLLSNPGLIVNDYVIDQLKELIKHQTPNKKFSNKALEALAHTHLGNVSAAEYGVWVYYPWSNRLVHIVDENEFIDLRTSRNQHKITIAERDLLSEKKIGVIGLSVGQSVSVTLAMERICGELRLADFDVLELTNLNRIRTGIHNLGLPKVYAVAREIAEIDPFLKVVCYPEGITEANMDDFFTKNGKLDLLVEESDGFDIKILCRYKARDLGIPVIMEASDKCMVDVERFDLEPNRSILHGLVNHLDVKKLKNLKTNEEKIPFLLDILGIETASLRLKASMLEIDQSITTWPQLASAVTMGGGITADVCRRMLLNQYTESGRYHIDIEALIANKIPPVPENKFQVKDFDYPELTLSEMTSTAQNFNSEVASDISEADILLLVEAAIAAPSAGNNQPWKWLSKDKKLYLFHDKKQSVSWADFEDLISNIGLGTAIENLQIKAGSLGYRSNLTIADNFRQKGLVAVFTFQKSDTSFDKSKNIAPYLFIRNTNRKKGDYTPLDDFILNDIKNEAELIQDARIFYATDKSQIEKIGKVVSVAERIRFLHPQGHHDLFTKEIKWGMPDEIILHGLDVKTLELSFSDETGLKIASDPAIISLLNQWKAGAAFEKISYQSIITSSAIGLVTMPFYSSTNWINGGRATQRAWLCATKHNLAFHPISAPLFFYTQIENGGKHNFESKSVVELEKNMAVLSGIFPALNENSGVFMFRLSNASQPSAKSLRKNISEFYFKV